MQIGMIGLGRMGGNMALRLMNKGHHVVAYNRSQEKRESFQMQGIDVYASVPEMIQKLEAPRIVWIMLPAGETVDNMIDLCTAHMEKDDILVDGGNSLYKDDISRAKKLKEKNIHYLDVGVSGGVWGLKNGYCMMCGGERKIFEYIEPVLKSLGKDDSYMYCGPSGSGHFVKMIHNGVEYAMMQAYGEGFELLKSSPLLQHTDLGEIASLWNKGSVVRSWLLELLEEALDKDSALSGFSGEVGDSGEGRWTAMYALENGVSAEAISYSVYKRFMSQDKNLFSDKVLSALRAGFGGHVEEKSE